jgi:hypothetical protein
MKYLVASRFAPDGYRHNVHRATVPHGDSVQDVAAPSYWAQIAAKMNIGDRVDVFEESGAWYAEFIVLHTGRGWAKLGRTVYAEFEDVAEEAAPADYDVRYGGPVRLHEVIRLADNLILKGGFRKRKEALEWLEQHQAMAAA